MGCWYKCIAYACCNRKNIKLIFYAEHGESEYGGNVIKEDSDRIRDLEEVLENQIGDVPENWIDDYVSLNDINMYKYPEADRISEKNNRLLFFLFF